MKKDTMSKDSMKKDDGMKKDWTMMKKERRNEEVSFLTSFFRQASLRGRGLRGSGSDASPKNRRLFPFFPASLRAA